MAAGRVGGVAAVARGGLVDAVGAVVGAYCQRLWSAGIEKSSLQRCRALIFVVNLGYGRCAGFHLKSNGISSLLSDGSLRLSRNCLICHAISIFALATPLP